MEYNLISNLGIAIDNVYNNVAPDASRKTIASIKSEKLVIEYITILNIPRECRDTEAEIRREEKTAKDMISGRLKSIKECYKTCSGKALRTKAGKENCRSEIISVSAFSPVKIIKCVFTQEFEVS